MQTFNESQAESTKKGPRREKIPLSLKKNTELECDTLGDPLTTDIQGLGPSIPSGLLASGEGAETNLAG